MKLSKRFVFPIAVLLLTQTTLPVRAQNWDEACQELRGLEAELRNESDPQFRNMIEAQLAPLRQQCNPMAQKVSVPRIADPTLFGRYRLIAELTMEIDAQTSPGQIKGTQVRTSQVDFEVRPGIDSFKGQGSFQYSNTRFLYTAPGCNAQAYIPTVNHTGELFASSNPDGRSLNLVITDAFTGGALSQVVWTARCEDVGFGGPEQFLQDAEINIQNLPLRHGAQITEVTPVGNYAKLTVRASLQKI